MMDDRFQLRFTSICDFKWCMKCHGEVQFIYNGKAYSITHPHGVIDIGEGYYLREGIAYNLKSHTPCESERKICHTADEVLEYTIGDMRLRDIIQQVEVVERTI